MFVRKGVAKVAEVDRHLEINEMPGKTVWHTTVGYAGLVNDKNAHPYTTIMEI